MMRIIGRPLYLAIFYATTACCAESSLCAKLLCQKKSSEPSFQRQTDDNDSMPSDLQQRIKTIQTADQSYLAKRRLRCLEDCCACSCFTGACIASCGASAIPGGHLLIDQFNQVDKKRAQDRAKLNAALMPPSQAMN